MESPIRILSSAGHDKTCHICGNMFSKASLPSHQRICIKKRFNKSSSSQRIVMSAGIYGHGPQMHPCASCMNQIPQHKMMSHLRVCKGNSNLQFLKSTSISHSTESDYIKDINTLSKIIPVRSVRTAQEKRFYPMPFMNQNEQMLTPMPPSKPKNLGLAISSDSFAINELNSSFHQMDINETPINNQLNQSESNSLQFYENLQDQQEVNALQPHLPCPLCQRKFNAQDRLEKHILACTKASKSRKVFDTTKARVQGTDMEKYVLSPLSKKKPNPQQQLQQTKKSKKSNWREKHLQFIQAIRGAKGAPMGKQGNSTQLPLQVSSDLVSCPICNRSFNEESAKRHIPMCQSKANLQKREPKRGDVKKDALLKKRLTFKPPKPNKAC